MAAVIKHNINTNASFGVSSTFVAFLNRPAHVTVQCSADFTLETVFRIFRIAFISQKSYWYESLSDACMGTSATCLFRVLVIF